MPLSDDPAKREKQLANLDPKYGNKVLREVQAVNAELTKKKLLEQAPNYYPNLSRLAEACNVSRSLIVYFMETDKDFGLEMEENFKQHLDEIESNVLNTGKKEQYAGIGMGVLNRIHPRYKEEKQGNILANITINMPNISNPYDQKIDDAQIIDDGDT